MAKKAKSFPGENFQLYSIIQGVCVSHYRKITSIYMKLTFFFVSVVSMSASILSVCCGSTQTCSQGPWAERGLSTPTSEPSTPSLTKVTAESPAKLLNVK